MSKKQPPPSEDKGQGRDKTRGHTNTKQGEYGEDAKGVEEEGCCVGSEYVLSLPARSRPLDGSQEGGESWAEGGRRAFQEGRTT